MKPICLLLLTLAGGLGMAQSADTPKEPPRFYKLDFVMRDLEAGKVITARSYSIIVSTGNGRAGIRTGNKIPVGGPDKYTMIDVGTNIDCNGVADLHDELEFELTAEVTSLLQENDPHPVVRQNRWNSHVTVPLKKPTIVFSSDDNTTKHVMQLEVTATPRT